MSDIESRVRRLEDRAESEDLAVRYFLASDFDDFDAIADAIAENGTFSAGGFPARLPAVGSRT
ncbi:nuclear transport factor 2 family protein [Rhodococcus wratislaviensis]|uniref:Uncharacterized protein n=1 Tax=Rhodococcus wratislaviensis NBRC 100605 TaxID=1219028 RepID=X0Q2P7_RHOWR|nr:nuclear transport factor 2 family protein [Rhodococcus wratislaviensis]GAF50398.1 hypothetical protein RW1_095_00160 [Rhodococcus wratislaviensis NBRC 100605]